MIEACDGMLGAKQCKISDFIITTKSRNLIKHLMFTDLKTSYKAA